MSRSANGRDILRTLVNEARNSSDASGTLTPLFQADGSISLLAVSWGLDLHLPEDPAWSLLQPLQYDPNKRERFMVTTLGHGKRLTVHELVMGYEDLPASCRRGTGRNR